MVDDKDDALAICYKAAYGELNLQKFVDMLEHEVYTIIEDGAEYKETALFSLPAMAILKRIDSKKYSFSKYGRDILWTRAKLRSAAQNFDIVILISGSKKVKAVFNFERSMKNPNWIEWAMSNSNKMNDVLDLEYYCTCSDCIDPEATRELVKDLNPEGKKYMVFENACAKQFFKRLGEADNGLWDTEFVFNTLLRAEDGNNHFTNIKSRSFLTCVDKLDNEFDVAAAVGFVNDGLQMLYARDAMWDKHLTSTKDFAFYPVNY